MYKKYNKVISKHAYKNINIVSLLGKDVVLKSNGKIIFFGQVKKVKETKNDHSVTILKEQTSGGYTRLLVKSSDCLVNEIVVQNISWEEL